MPIDIDACCVSVSVSFANIKSILCIPINKLSVLSRINDEYTRQTRMASIHGCRCLWLQLFIAAVAVAAMSENIVSDGTLYSLIFVCCFQRIYSLPLTCCCRCCCMNAHWCCMSNVRPSSAIMGFLLSCSALVCRIINIPCSFSSWIWILVCVYRARRREPVKEPGCVCQTIVCY